jgi:uncharacterized protein (TIRG00374 family)
VESERRRWAVRLVQYGVGIGALAWVLGQVEWERVATLVGEITPATAAALLLVTAVGLLARFYTWYALMARLRPATLAGVARVDLIVNFVNQLLPSRLSGRAAAPFVLRTETGLSYPAAVAVAGVHTGLYALVYGLVSSIGIGFALDRLPIEILALLALSTLLYFLAGALVLLAGLNLGVLTGVADRLERVLRMVPAVGERLAGLAGALPTFTADSADAFRELSSAPGVLAAYAAGWCGALLLAPGLRVWLLFDALGTGFEPALFLPLYLVAAYSVTLLPLTPGGIGVTEATATAVFVALGVPAAVVVPVVFVDRFLGVYLPALAGWYPSLRIDLSGLAAE